MNSINNGLTASNILRASANAKTDDIKEQSGQDVKDTLLKSEQNDNKKLDFIKIDEKTKQAMVKGATIGGVTGAAIGGIAGYASAWHEIKSTVPANSITVDWQEPNIQKDMIGYIPEDFKSSFSTYSHWDLRLTKKVFHKNPEMQGGNPVMYDQSKTYDGYGESEVGWKNHKIKHYELDGWKVDRDTHRVKNGEWYDKEYEYEFTPKYDVKKVGDYDTPKVKFDNGGISVGLRTLAGAGIGLGIGAFTGAIAGAIVANATEN